MENKTVIKVNGKVYIVTRHFVGQKTLKEVLYDALLHSIDRKK